MYKTIEQYCNNGNNNGLMLIDMPTGTGKTHNVLDYIFDACTNPENEKQKFFFVTTLKKNLPVEELKQRFKKAGKASLAEEKILFLDSNVDSVVNNLTDELIGDIPEDIKRTDEYKEFAHAVKMVQKYSKGNKDYDLKSIVKDINDDLRTHKEPKFRKMIEGLLSKTFKKVDDKLYAIKTDKYWQWLGKLYPAVFTRDKQIIFMSMDKLISRNSTIVEPAYQFFASNIIDGAVFFIDEFDATKDTILKSIIDNNVKEQIDYIDLFNGIYSTLQNHKFHRDLFTRAKNDKEYNKSLKQTFDDVKVMAENIYKKYSLQFSHKTVDNDIAASKNFLFQDHQYHSILDGNKTYIAAKTDNENNVNRIEFTKEKPEMEKENIQIMLGKIRGFISYFTGNTAILAHNHMQLRRERRTANEDEYTYEQAIRSVLNEYKLSGRYVDFLTNQILLSTRSGGPKREDEDFDLSFYKRGFRYFSFEDSPEHDMHSKMMLYSFEDTPEKIMLKFCEKAKVVGISATASLESVIGNYDIDYIKSKLGSSFVKPSEADYLRMRDEFAKSIKNYSDVKIVAKTLGINKYGKYDCECWKDIFENEEIAAWTYEFIENSVSSSKDFYFQKRYLRIAQAYLEFVRNEDIQSFLCVLNKHPKKDDSELNQNVLERIFDKIAEEKGSNLKATESVKYLIGDEYESNKDGILKVLHQGKRLFVISAYQTIGAGQNLQYKIPKGRHDLVKINDWNSREEKDFDAIYLDNPTNLLVNLGNNLDVHSFAKYLYQVEYFQESAELSVSSTLLHVRKAFKVFTTQHLQKDWVENLYDLDSSKVFSIKTIIQAIGRICRTNIKNKNIYIFADEKIADCVDLSLLEKRLLNPEFEALLRMLGNGKEKSDEHKKIVNAAERDSAKANSQIKNMLQGWTPKKIANWKKLREFALKNPTVPKEEEDLNPISKYFYINVQDKRNEYYYNQEQDFNNIKISFDSDKDHPLTVSSGAAHLDILMQNQKIRNLFEKNNWATFFEENECIMSPPVFNNIYKGAIGEVVGKYVLEEQHGYILEEIENPDIFELFDFKIKDLPIYVDFKNWHESTDFDNNEMLEKINSKSDVCPDCKCVFIINIVASNKYISRSVKLENGVEVIIIPSLFNDHNGQLRLDGKSHKYLEDKKLEYSNYNKQN